MNAKKLQTKEQCSSSAANGRVYVNVSTEFVNVSTDYVNVSIKTAIFPLFSPSQKAGRKNPCLLYIGVLNLPL